jgi:hypothetical protein
MTSDSWTSTSQVELQASDSFGKSVNLGLKMEFAALDGSLGFYSFMRMGHGRDD